MSDKNTILAEIEAVTQEVQDLLRKSGMPMAKADDEEEKKEEAPAPAAEAAPAPEAAPADGIEEQAETPEEAVAEEHEEGHELHDASEVESPEQLSAEAATLSDEELDLLLEVLMSEKEGRVGSQEPAAEEAPAEETPPAEPAEKSMPEAYAKLGKSMEEQNQKLAKSLESLSGALDALNKKVETLAQAKTPAPATKIANKAPAANAQDMQVLHKSAPIAKRLTKSETVEFLEGQLKKGNKLVNSELMYDVATAKSEEDLFKVQDALVRKGIELPKL